jgi:hypothetical protein
MALLIPAIGINGAALSDSASWHNTSIPIQKNTETKDTPGSFVGDMKEFGLLKNVEDSGYPFVTLTIEFPERGFTEYFSLNLEEFQSLDAETLSNAVGKYISFDYNSDIFNVLLELTLDGESLLNAESGYEYNDNTQIIIGILSNAAEVTAGDIPGELYIQTEEEITEKFPFFITPEIVEANGRSVVGYYEQRTINTITYLEIKQ